MKKQVYGSMLSPFCYINSLNKKWVMICGLQIIIEKQINKIKIRFNKIAFSQWTYKIQQKIKNYITK